MSRRTARKHAFFLVFQIEFHKPFDALAQSALYLEDKSAISDEDAGFIRDELDGVLANLTDIDALIAKHLSGWEIDRVAKVDLALLRLAVYEMLHEPSIPNGVSINEAVELAKQFGEDAPIH